jgi:hypothetical protein
MLCDMGGHALSARGPGWSAAVLLVAAAGTLCVLGLAPRGAIARSIEIRGNHFVDGRRVIRLIGVDRSGSEYACSGPATGGGFGYGIFAGPVDDRAIRAMLTWKVNAVMVGLNEACWLGGYGRLNAQYTGRRYQAAIADYVRRLNARRLYVVLDLMGAAPGDNAFGSSTVSTVEIPMADADHSLTMWRSVAARFKRNRMVLFHPFDEPNSISWSCVRDGCMATDKPQGHGRYGSYSAVGNQALVDAIRSTGAAQPILLSGIDFAGDLSQWERYLPRDPRHQVAPLIDSFDYADSVGNSKGIIRRLGRRYPVLVGGFGDTHCRSDYSRRLMGFADSLGMSYFAWTWNTVQDYGGCSNALLDDPGPQINGQPAGYYTGRPSGYGRGVRDHYIAVDALRRF